MQSITPPDLDLVLGFIAEDARHGRFACWSMSTVIDENTAEAVVDEHLFDALHAAAGIPARYPIGNAGVIHVYGYWFSTALTPYGYKRDRWQDGVLARVLGADPTAFHLTGVNGSTPLERVTARIHPHLATPAEDDASADVVVEGRETRVVVVGADTDDENALIYGVREAEEWLLITTFPIASTPESIVDDFRTDRRLRWNAAPRTD